MINILFDGFFYSSTAYSSISRAILKYLSVYPDLNILISPRDRPQQSVLTGEEHALLEYHKSKRIDKDLTIAISHVIPFLFKHHKVKYNICLTEWPSLKMSKECNVVKRADEIWTPCPFIESFKELKNKVFYFPWGVDPDYFKPFPKRKKPIETFLFVARYGWIKGWDVLLPAFKESCTGKKLIVVINPSNHHASKEAKRHGDNIKVVQGPVSMKDMQNHYLKADALISMSRAESVGMPTIEAAYSGLRLFVPDIPAFRKNLEADCWFETKQTYSARIKKYGHSCSKYGNIVLHEPVFDDVVQKLKNADDFYKEGNAKINTYTDIANQMYMRLKEIARECAIII